MQVRIYSLVIWPTVSVSYVTSLSPITPPSCHIHMIIPRHLMWGFSTYILSIIHDVCIIIPGRALVNNNLGRHLVSLKYRRWKTPHWHYLLVTLIWDLHVSWHEVHPPSVTIILNDECFSTPFSYLCNVSVCPCNWTEEYSVREDGQTVYLRYQTTQTPSLANPLIRTTHQGPVSRTHYMESWTDMSQLYVYVYSPPWRHYFCEHSVTVSRARLSPLQLSNASPVIGIGSFALVTGSNLILFTAFDFIWITVSELIQLTVYNLIQLTISDLIWLTVSDLIRLTVSDLFWLTVSELIRLAVLTWFDSAFFIRFDSRLTYLFLI